MIPSTSTPWPSSSSATWTPLLALVACSLLVGCQSPASENTQAGQEQAASADLVERGEYLVSIMGCHDCHTPMQISPQGPVPDMSRMLSGHPDTLDMPSPPPLMASPWSWIGSVTNTAYAGPWGISYATNLTPHETGLGTWTEAQFVRALKTGRHRGAEGGRSIMPPMPWQAYSEATEEDLKAIFAYLQSLPPIDNQPPPYQPPGE